MFEAWPIPANGAAFAAAAAIVWFAGTRLARYADAISKATGIGQAVLGMLMLGGVTSLPEIAVATTATLQGVPALSINDVLGSASINVVILALADAVIGRDALTSVIATPAVLLQGVLVIMVMALVVGPALTGDVLLFGVGAWSWMLLATYLIALVLISRATPEKAWKPLHPTPEGGDDDADKPQPDALRGLILRSTAAGIAILAAGYVLAETGRALAEQTGLGTSFFGAVVLGAATSLPEISTVLAAVKLRRYSMAVADIFGTNLFNVTIVVLVDALHPGGPVLLEAGRFASFSALLALLLTAIYVCGMVERRDRTVLRMGVDSLSVLFLYGAGLAVLYTLR